MIIEFIGTPGAGKTTLLAAAAGWLNERGYWARSVIDAARPVAARTVAGRATVRLAPPSWRRALLWQLFYGGSELERARFLAGHPGLMWDVWRYQYSRPLSAADRRHVLRWFNHQTGVYEFLRRRATPADVFLFDEGFIHRAVQLFASEREMPEPDAVGAYVARLPRPDLLIRPTAPLEVCLRRVRARGVWARFAAKSADDMTRFMVAAERAVTLAVEVAHAHQWPIIEVDNGGDDPTAAADRLRRALADHAPVFTSPAKPYPVPA